MEFQFDTSDFNKKFGKLMDKAVPALAEKGMGRAMLVLLGDCVMVVPTVPLKEGWLRGSGSVFVQNKLAGISDFGRPGLALQAHSENIDPMDIVGLIGFNAPYAARLHEGLGFKFREPSSGPKYLESKMLRNKDSYMKEIADTIKEGARD